MRAVHGCWLAASLALVAASADAELFRCKGPDGKVVFTDQQSVCPGADAFEPSGVVHEVPTSATKGGSPAAPSRALAPDPDEAQAMLWRQKKRDAQERLDQLAQRREWMKRFVGHCNRGGYVTTFDDAGIEKVVNCSKLRREFAGLEAQEAELRNYLDVELVEECRKAGCLPGWLR